MTRTSCRPPRPIEASQPARLLAANARIRNSRRRTIGAGARASTTPKATSRTTPPSMPGKHDRRVRPAHRVPVVGLDAVGDRGQDRQQAGREQPVAPPVDAPVRGAGAVADFAQARVGPDGAEDSERHRHEEDQAPAHLAEQAAGQQTEERPGDGGDLVDADRRAPPGRREDVGEDGRRVRQHHRGADTLHDAPADEPQRACPAGRRVERQGDRGHREHGESEGVDAGAPVEVAKPAHGHDQGRRDEQVPHEHPQEVADVAGRERVEADAAEDRRQADDDDRAVDRRDEHAERGVGQDHPPVAGAVLA